MYDNTDSYSHLDLNVFYILENIPSKLKDNDLESLKIHSDYNCQQIVQCTCVDSCTEVETCKCLINKNINYEKHSCELVATKETLLTDKPILECNQLCSCGIACNNRLIQFGPRKYLKVFNCSVSNSAGSKGLGLFTEQSIPKGGYICEYAGEILTKKEAMERNQFNKNNNFMNYIICVNEYSGDNKIQTFIDPSQFGNIGRYLNHSCEPNCIILPIRVDNPIPKLCFFAIDNIEVDAELTFDYGSKSENVVIEDSKMECKIPCLCKSKHCRKWLPSESYD